MDEEEWLTCANVGRLRRHLRSLPGSRGRRWMLFNCACCRRIWTLLGKSSRMFIETVERHADSVSPPPLGDVWEWEQKAQYAVYEEFRRDLAFRIHHHAATAAASIKKEGCKTAEEVAIAVAMFAPKEGVLNVNAALSVKAAE